MTADSLLADLTSQGFFLRAHGNNVQVAPFKRLTDAQRETIQENKGELLALLRDGMPPGAKVPPPKVEPPPVVSPAPMPAPLEAPVPERPTTVAKPAATSSWPPPEACPICFWLPPGSPHCPRCQVVHKAGPDNLGPGKVMGSDGVVYQVSYPPDPIVVSWHRCDACYASFEGVRPRFGAAKLCPKCLPGMGSRAQLNVAGFGS